MAKQVKAYRAADYSKDEVKLLEKFYLQRDDSKKYFLEYLKPRYDRSYKLYTAYNGDRAKEIQDWQANVFVPYTLGVIETIKPRILDARPDFTVRGRNENDQDKALKVSQVTDFTWEIAGMDDQTEDLVSASLVYGISWLQTFWKKDVRKTKYLAGRDITTQKKTYKEKSVTHYDAPAALCVDNYDFRYDWRNTTHSSKQFFFQRFVKNGAEIRRMFPDADPVRLEQALSAFGTGDLEDYGSIRLQTKQVHTRVTKGADSRTRMVDYYSGNGLSGMMDRYQNASDQDLRFHEVYLWWRPYEDKYTVMVNDVPILYEAEEPNPYDFKEAPYIDIPFLRLPFEYEGLGYPLLLEQPALMLNLIKNQRLDATTMSIHKMFVVNPLANIQKNQLVTRPFGIIWSPDPNGVREIQFSDIKESAYREEEMLKADMRYASGVDDISMGQSGTVGSATESRHLREATLERVRLFINHLGSGYSRLMRMWLSMYNQFLSESMKIRITDANGDQSFELIEKDDIKGEFDLVATVLPSIAGRDEVMKKQGMDLFQLLINLPFIDPKKLTSKILHPWSWTLSSISKDESQMAAQPGMPGDPNAQAAGMSGDPNARATPQLDENGMPIQPPPGPAEQIINGEAPGAGTSGGIPQDVIQQALGLLKSGDPNQLSGLGAPQNLVRGDISKGAPSTKGVGKSLIKPGGAVNRTGKVNTNVPSSRGASDPQAAILNRTGNLQR